jgi:dTDP-L-rhamnose 4-epimerase
MTAQVLITGGAGFIGRRVARELMQAGDAVRILDNLHEQVHGDGAGLDPALREAELIRGDVRDRAAVDRALRGCDRVVHLAAEVGVGQSMYAIERYTDVNERGTAVLFEALAANPVERVVVASSMSVYGEGLYRDAEGNTVPDARRPDRASGSWDPVDARGRPLTPVATPEWKPLALTSIYALNKYAQERMALILAPTYGMEAVALRLWNVYGPGQALSNPYTGVLAIFASRALNGEPPLIFEDGRQRRDFVHVDDAAQAFQRALERPGAAGGVFNIGSGEDRSIAEVAEALNAALGRPELGAEIVGKMRAGDVRHNFPDISAAHEALGYAPQVGFADGVARLAEWLADQRAEDRVPGARRELEARGLVA